ncbi:MAG: hypothetical protein QXI58_00265 [Candidatus Micrarchaeia archaeon]
MNNRTLKLVMIVKKIKKIKEAGKAIIEFVSVLFLSLSLMIVVLAYKIFGRYKKW